MSSSTVEAFLERARSDEKVQALLAAGGLQDVVAEAAREGFQITVTELEDALARRAGSAELRDEDLEKVAGGANASGVIGPSIHSQMPQRASGFGPKGGLAR